MSFFKRNPKIATSFCGQGRWLCALYRRLLLEQKDIPLVYGNPQEIHYISWISEHYKPSSNIWFISGLSQLCHKSSIIRFSQLSKDLEIPRGSFDLCGLWHWPILLVILCNRRFSNWPAQSFSSFIFSDPLILSDTGKPTRPLGRTHILFQFLIRRKIFVVFT